MYKKSQIRGGFFMVPLGGVDLRVFLQKEEADSETGEVVAVQDELYVIGLEAGQNNGSEIAEVAPQNALFEPIGTNAPAVRVVGNARMQEPTRMTPQQPPKKHVTGANEYYQPRNLEEQKAEATVRMLKKENDRAERIAKERRAEKEQERQLQLQQDEEAKRQAAEEEAERLAEEQRQAKLAADAAAAGE